MASISFDLPDVFVCGFAGAFTGFLGSAFTGGPFGTDNDEATAGVFGASLDTSAPSRPFEAAVAAADCVLPAFMRLERDSTITLSNTVSGTREAASPSSPPLDSFTEGECRTSSSDRNGGVGTT